MDEHLAAAGLPENKKTLLGIIIFVLLIIGVVIAVYLSQQKTLFKPKALEIKPISGPETSLTLLAPSSASPQSIIRVSVLVRSDIDAANLFVSKLKFPTDLLEVVSIATAPCRIRPACLDARPACMMPEPVEGWCLPSAGTSGSVFFINNWIEKTFDNQAGTISLAGGVPAPGYKTTVGQPSGIMADIVFQTKKVGSATVSFETDSAIYRNSDNVNVLSIKRDANFKIVSKVPPPITPTPTLGVTSNRVFVTSTTYNGNLGGLAGADAKCQERAKAAGMGSSVWKAWLSDGTATAADRLGHSTFPYILLNGTVIANNWSDLVDGSLQNPINLTENKTIPNYMSCVWTQTTTTGGLESIASNVTACSNFTAADTNYSYCGRNGSIDSNWTRWSTDRCDQQHPLYCFEQATPVAITLTPTPVLKGDVNGDGKITLVDMSALLSRWGKTGAEVGFADLNGDGTVNTFDYSLLLQILIQNGVIKQT